MQASQVPLCIMQLETLVLHEAWPVEADTTHCFLQSGVDGGFQTAFLKHFR